MVSARRPVGRKFSGAVTQGWHAYNISTSPDGLGQWTDEQLFSYLKGGHADGVGSASGTMGEAVDMSLRHLPDADIRSMVVYLRSVPSVPNQPEMKIDLAAPAMVASQRYQPADPGNDANGLGLHLFQQSCASCHAWDGEGQQTPYASLKGDQTVNDPSGTNAMQVIIRGSDVTSQAGREFMPAFGGTLSDPEIAALTNYVLAHFGNKTGAVTAADVAQARLEGH